MTKIFFLIIYFNIFSLQALSLETVCSRNKNKLNIIKKTLNEFKLPSETIYLHKPSHCLILEFKEHRRLLYQKLLLINNASFSELSSFANEKRGILDTKCNIKFNKIIKRKMKNNNLKISDRINFFENNSQLNKSILSSLILGAGIAGEITVYDNQLLVTCTPRVNSYVLKISFKSSHSKINTIVNLVKGQKVNIGSISKNLANKEDSINLRKGFDKKIKKGQKMTEYFLWIE